MPDEIPWDRKTRPNSSTENIETAPRVSEPQFAPNGVRASSRPIVTERLSTHVPAAEVPKKNIVRDYFESAVVTFVMALFGMTFILQAVKVPTGSMKNTIYIGDHLLVNKFIFGSEHGIKFPIMPDRDVRRGDVIVFKYPYDPQVNYVKRVIGMPGDTVEYNSQTHRVYINGKELPEHRVKVYAQKPDSADPLEPSSDEGAPPGAWYTVYYQRDNDSGSDAIYGVTQPFRVPKKGDPIPDEIKNNPLLRDEYDANHDGLYDTDQYFCMGDNRDNSEDSRYWGTVPRSNLVGRAMFVYWSINPDAQTMMEKTRWWRTGKFIK